MSISRLFCLYTIRYMAGIYIHIPFCKTKCIYCDFYSKTNTLLIDDYIKAICLELKMRKEYLQNEPVETIYFGGGTPSLLSTKQIQTVLSEIKRQFILASNPEITLECNPDDLISEYIQNIHSTSINRISIGIQSFNDDELHFLNRRHTVKQTIEAVQKCKQEGFDNISIDLMYGLPGQTIESWQNTLKQAIQLNIQHISSYHLIYEESTPIYKNLDDRTIIPVSEEMSVRMFEELIETLTNKGFIHYEISNFAMEGYFSKHNSSYWKDVKYLGVGASAHSYSGISRDYNIVNTEEYIQLIFAGESVTETESINRDTAYNDYIVTSLRTMWGISLVEIEKKFGLKKKKYCLQQAEKFISENLLFYQDEILTLTRKGIFISDGIMADLLWVD